MASVQQSKRQKWLVLISVAMGVFLATIDGSIVNVTLPTLVEELHTNFATIQWVVLAYLLTITTLLLSIGRLGDMIGKKPLYLAGLIIFTTGSALCGLAQNVYQLIGFRVLQAFGASMIMALGAAIITEVFPPEERGKALGINGTMVSIGIISGPMLGGLILQAFSWHWIFFVNIPVGIVGIWMVSRFIPYKKSVSKQVFDYTGAITLLIALLGLLLGLSRSQQTSLVDPVVLALMALGLVFMGIFILVEFKVQQPMIDLRMFRNSLFSVNLITGLMAFIASSGTIFIMPFYLQNVLNYDPSTTGLLMGCLPLTIGILAPVAGALSDRYGTRPLASLGLLILILGYIGISTLGTTTTAIGYILRFLLIGFGVGIFQSPNNSAIMGAVPPSRLGVASGLLSITRTLGQTSGIALLGALWSYRVAANMGLDQKIDASQAPAAAQVAGMNETSFFVIGLISIAWLLSVWAWRQWKLKQKAELEVPPG